MRPIITKPIAETALVLILLPACSIPVQDESGGDAEGQTFALHSHTTVNCNETQTARLNAATTLTRIAGRSAAFAACLDRIVRDGAFVQGDRWFGPYQACGAGTSVEATNHEALWDQPPERQIARMLNLVNSPFPLRHRCTSTGCGSAPACSGGVPGADLYEKVNWGSVSSNINGLAGLIAHEVMHGYGYGHPGATACGYTEEEYGSQAESLVLVHACIREVLNQSDEFCALGGQCAFGEKYMVRNFPGSSGDCECVQDVNGANNLPGFGSAMAVGDFDGDTFDDIAVLAESGLHTFRGTPVGPRFGPALYTIQWYDYAHEMSGTWRIEGYQATAGDYNGDGFDDLALSGFDEDEARYYVYLVPGSSLGLRGNSVQRLGQAGLGGDERYDRFGLATTTADIDSDGNDDLVVGAPNESPGSHPSCGGVYMYRGNGDAALGTTHAGYVMPWRFFYQHSNWGLSCAAVDDFGLALAARPGSVAVGAPGKRGLGAVYLFTYSPSTDQFTFSHELLPNPLNNVGSPPFFGSALTFLKRTNGADLAIGAYGEHSEAGGVYVFAGPSYTTLRKYVTQSTGGGGNEAGDHFGISLGAADLDANGYDDLLVGAPREKVGLIRHGVTFYFWSDSSGPGSGSYLQPGHLYNAVPHGPRNIDTVWGDEPLNSELFGSAIASGKFFGVGTQSIAIASAQDYVLDGLFEARPHGSVFVFKTLKAAMRMDRSSMRFGDIVLSP